MINIHQFLVEDEWRFCTIMLVTAYSSNDDNGNTPGNIGDDGPTVETVVLGDRPSSLIALLPDGELKTRLETCNVSDVQPQPFSIAHRGAPFEFPEHSVEAYQAATNLGPG